MIARFLRRVLAATLLSMATGLAQGFERAQPEDVGLATERLDALTQLLREGVNEGAIPGAVLLVARHGKIAWFEAVGMLDPATKAPMTRDAIFRIYSMSKPITTVAAMMLYEAGKLTLDEPVAKYLPQFKDMQVGLEKANATGGSPSLTLVRAEHTMTIADLMRHTSGLTYGFFGNLLVKKAYLDSGLTKGEFTNAEFVDRLAKLPLAFEPGTTWDYGHSTDVLGRVIEVISGKSLFTFEQEHLLGPLGMDDTSFYGIASAKQNRIAEPFVSDRVLGTDAEIQDPRVPNRWESGGGGMVGTAIDYARFAQMLLSGGSREGKRILGPRTVAYMTADQMGSTIAPGPYFLPGPGYGFGLGFGVRKSEGGPAIPGSPGDYYWGGVGGTYFWNDPKEDLLVVFMMQAPKQRVHYRALLRDMIYSAIKR
jgi:CubicO group peptidase (beta-lactamase class C family)